MYLLDFQISIILIAMNKYIFYQNCSNVTKILRMTILYLHAFYENKATVEKKSLTDFNNL